MERALYDPVSGYYRREHHPAQGEDYITGATHFPLFARVVADYLKRHFTGKTGLTLLDAGCGSGAFLTAIQPHLPGWRLVGVDLHKPENLPPGAVHLTRPEDVEPVEGVIFSYELFDALPCHCLRYREGAWHEMYVRQSVDGLDWEEGEVSSPDLLDYLQNYSAAGREGQMVEVCLEARDLYSSLAQRLTRGLILTFDYGRKAKILYNPNFFPGGTLMTYRQHRMGRDLLANPGEQDITSAVNFTALEKAGQALGLKTLSWGTQGSFLVENGIAELAASVTSPVERRNLQALFLGSMGQDIRLLIQARG